MVKDISYHVQRIAALHISPYINNGDYISPGTLVALRDLASDAGVTGDILKIERADLIALYAVARKKPSSAFEVAARINRKHSFPDILGPIPAPETPSAPPTAAPGLSATDVAAMISDALSGVSGDMNEAVQRAVSEMGGDMAMQIIDGLAKAHDSIPQMVADALKDQTPTRLEIITPASPTSVALGIVHYKTGDIMRAVMAGLNVYLHGPAGSGKTTVALKIAEALKLPFYFAAKVESEYLLLGFKDARGETVRTQFREAYEHGGLFLFDELDGSAAGAVVALNAALANGMCPFPDGIIKRHADFHCIAAGNTVLTGASRQYVGRSQLDAASVDRFAFIEFDYDEQLETALASNVQWAKHVQAIRAAIKSRTLNHLVTPRATLDGCKSLAAGFTWEQAEMMHVYKGLDAATIEQIRSATERSIAA